MLAEQFDLSLEGSRAHGDILPSKITKVKAFCLEARWSHLAEPPQDLRHSSAAYALAARELSARPDLARIEEPLPLTSPLQTAAASRPRCYGDIILGR